jgi:hypothetical protein
MHCCIVGQEAAHLISFPTTSSTTWKEQLYSWWEKEGDRHQAVQRSLVILRDECNFMVTDHRVVTVDETSGNAWTQA